MAYPFEHAFAEGVQSEHIWKVKNGSRKSTVILKKIKK